MDIHEMINEDNDNVEVEPKEIKYTDHQREFQNICSKVNSDKSTEIFLKLNDKFSKWNLKDRFA